ncbi:hypothetical protein P639_7129 [Acinetobacter baumannii UH0207]|nr:hypothetical protein P639_7129 [Acinetobacter baumannii UH0207]
MLADPSKKYRRMYQRVDLPDRQWPNNEITKSANLDEHGFT